MEEKSYREKMEFIRSMLDNRYISFNDRKRLLSLATQEIENINVAEKENENKKDSSSSIKDTHRPKDTASFLSLFENPNGFKFLIHDYSPNSEIIAYDDFITQIRNKFNEEAKKKKIPTSLYGLINVVLNGIDKNNNPTTWISYDGKPIKENYACKTWVEWAQNSRLHLLNNPEFNETINLFRRTIRVVKPSLKDVILDIASKYPKLKVTTKGLEKADFYTYVYYLKEGINRILKDMSQEEHSKYENVNISFESTYGEDFSTKSIRIMQIGSEAFSFDEVKKRFDGNDGGDFNEIQKFFKGYCNWSVEAIWDGKPKRWNILDDTEREEVEELIDAKIEGFTHILTYYRK